MKRIILIILAILLSSTMAMAADVTLKWDVVTGATGYKIYKSDDTGLTWTPVDVGNVLTYTWTGVAEDKTVYFKVSAYNANGETVRNWSGAWYDYRNRPVGTPGGVGIQ